MPAILQIPERMRRNVQLYFGERGGDWLAGLHTLIAEMADRWSLKLDGPFPNLSINYVAPATRTDGMRVVFKASVPNKEMRTEIDSLRSFDGNGMVKLLESDPGRGVMLIERLLPGNSLLSLDDDVEATGIAAGVMGRLKGELPAEHSFPSVEDWFSSLGKVRKRFDGGSGPLPSALLDSAERISTQLLTSTTQPVLLHGDLHHDNILESSRGPWLAIDPKGVVEDPAFEVCAFLRNHN
jgi:streptomycin 6-kinase